MSNSTITVSFYLLPTRDGKAPLTSTFGNGCTVTCLLSEETPMTDRDKPATFSGRVSDKTAGIAATNASHRLSKIFPGYTNTNKSMSVGDMYMYMLGTIRQAELDKIRGAYAEKCPDVKWAAGTVKTAATEAELDGMVEADRKAIEALAHEGKRAVVTAMGKSVGASA